MDSTPTNHGPSLPVHPSIHCFKEHFRYHHRHTGQNSIGDGDSIWPKTIEEKQKLSRILPTRSLSHEKMEFVHTQHWLIINTPLLSSQNCGSCGVFAWWRGMETCATPVGQPTVVVGWELVASVGGAAMIRSKLVNRERWRHARKLENDTSVYFIISMLWMGWEW